MKNNSAKKIGAFLLATAMTVPSVSDLAVFGALKISAAESVFSSSVTEVKGTVFNVDITAIDEVDIDTAKFALSSDSEGKNVLENVTVTADVSGNVAAESSVKLSVTVPEDTASGEYYLFYDGEAVGTIEYTAEETVTETTSDVSAVTEETVAVTAVETEMAEETEVSAVETETATEETGVIDITADGSVNVLYDDPQQDIVEAESDISMFTLKGISTYVVTDEIRITFTSTDTKVTYKAEDFSVTYGDDYTEATVSGITTKKIEKLEDGTSLAVYTLKVKATGIEKDNIIKVSYKESLIEGDLKYAAAQAVDKAGCTEINEGDALTVDLKNGIVKSGDSEVGSILWLKDEEGGYAFEKADSLDDVKWVLETLDGKVNTGAKCTIVGDELKITNTKASGAFNNSIVLKAVENKKPYETVYGEFRIYVHAKEPTEFIVTQKTGVFTKNENDGTYDLNIAAGASFSLPKVIKLKDGGNKVLVYDADVPSETEGEAGTPAESFTVLNGTVKGIKKGEGQIRVSSQYGDLDPITINVHIDDPAKFTARANTTSITLTPDVSKYEYFTVSGTTSSAGAKISQLKYDADLYEIIDKTTDKAVSVGTELADGAIELGVRFKTDNDGRSVIQSAAEFKSKKDRFIEVTLANGAEAKSIKISPSFALVNANVKSFKQTGKVIDGCIEVNIPIGTTYNLGMSVTPASAKNAFETVVDGDSDGIKIVGDVVHALKEGTYTVTAESVGKNERGETVSSVPYKINVYAPASGYHLNENENYAIRGGFLVENPGTTCNKSLVGGKTIELPCPNILGATNEKTVWTSSKAVGLGVKEENGKLKLDLIQPGTYTVTGVAEYSKQKVSFKVTVIDNIEKLNEDENEDNFTAVWEMLDANGEWKEIETEGAITAKIGQSLNIRMKGQDACAAVSYSSEDNNKVSVSPLGVVKVTKKAVEEETITITGKMTKKSGKNIVAEGSSDIKLNIKLADCVVTKLTVPASGSVGAAISVSVTAKDGKLASIAAKDVVWKYSADGSNWTECGKPDGKNVIGKIKFDAAGIYQVAPFYDNVQIGNRSAEIKIFDKAVKINPAVDNTFSSAYIGRGDTVTYTKPSALATTAYTNAEYIIPFDALYTKATKNGPKVQASEGDIVWTSSNINIATVETADASKKALVNGENNKNNFYAAACIKVGNSEGKVTLTGVFANSGKKINITLNVKGSADYETDKLKNAVADMGPKLKIKSDTEIKSKPEGETTITVVAELPSELQYLSDADKAKVGFDISKIALSSSKDTVKSVSGITVVNKEFVEGSEGTGSKAEIKITLKTTSSTATQHFYVVYNKQICATPIYYIKANDGTAGSLSLPSSVYVSLDSASNEYKGTLHVSYMGSGAGDLKFYENKFALTGLKDLKKGSVTKTDSGFDIEFSMTVGAYNAFQQLTDNNVCCTYDGVSVGTLSFTLK